jgi:hypothetical protein
MIIFTITDRDGDSTQLKTSRTMLTVGGSYTDDITLLDRDITPEHGVFKITGDEIVYTDTSFGTLVSGRGITGESVAFTPDDMVQIGGYTITCVVKQQDGVSQYDLSEDELSSNKSIAKHQSPKHIPETIPNPGDSPSMKSLASTADYSGQPSKTDESSNKMYSIPTTDMKEILYYLNKDEAVSDPEEQEVIFVPEEGEMISDLEEEEASSDLEEAEAPDWTENQIGFMKVITGIIIVSLFFLISFFIDSVCK